MSEDRRRTDRGRAERSRSGGSLRVPGQAVLRPLRHPHLERRGGRHRRGGGGPGRSPGYPVVVKAQVKVGGRGKAGGVKLAADADEVRHHAGNILGLDIKGHVVKRLWIEHASDIASEYYASFTLDRSAKKHLGMLSAEGGVEIEEVAVTNPDAIALLHVDPVDGLSLEAAREWVDRAGLDEVARGPGRRPPRRPLPLLHRGRLRPGRDQPPHPHPRRPGPRPRRQSDPRRQRRVPPSRVGGVRRQRRRGRARGPGQGTGPQLHRPRRFGRDHRQRRGPGHEHARRGQPVRRDRRPTSSTSAAAPTPT